jgi:hypothetical protein
MRSAICAYRAAFPRTFVQITVLSSSPLLSACSRRIQHCLHRAGKPVGVWLLRKLQWKAARRAAQRRNLIHIERGADHNRKLAAALQQGAATLVAGIPAAGTRGNRLADKTPSADFSAKLTFRPDHSGSLANWAVIRRRATVQFARFAFGEQIAHTRSLDILTSGSEITASSNSDAAIDRRLAGYIRRPYWSGLPSPGPV